jgi:anti-anti-sigma regulatory factor
VTEPHTHEPEDDVTATPFLRPDGATAMTEVVNPSTGSVRVSGHLTVQGADLLRGTVECLHRSGHDCVILDLQDVQTADEAGLYLLRTLRQELAADGGELLMRHLPVLSESGPAAAGVRRPALPVAVRPQSS